MKFQFCPYQVALNLLVMLFLTELTFAAVYLLPSTEGVSAIYMRLLIPIFVFLGAWLLIRPMRIAGGILLLFFFFSCLYTLAVAIGDPHTLKPVSVFFYALVVTSGSLSCLASYLLLFSVGFRSEFDRRYHSRPDFKRIVAKIFFWIIIMVLIGVTARDLYLL